MSGRAEAIPPPIETRGLQRVYRAKPREIVAPIDLLPAPLQVASLALPLTWWLEAVRRGLVGVGAPGRLASYGDVEVLGLLPATTAVFTLGFWIAFRLSERRARDRGMIDTITGVMSPAAARGTVGRLGTRRLGTRRPRCGSTKEARARTSRRCSARSGRSSTSAGCARSC